MRLTGSICCGLVLSTVWGCAAADPIAVWQGRLAQYVERQGNGDPGVLRDTVDLHSRRGPRPERITFAALGIAGGGLRLFAPVRDVRGVLVGVQEVGPASWFFFLVGTVKQRPRSSAGLEEVRALAFTADRGGLHWRVAAPDSEALARYVAALQKLGPLSAGSRPGNFPGPTDVFQLKLSDETAFITEPRSGATWELSLDHQAPIARSQAATGSKHNRRPSSGYPAH